MFLAKELPDQLSWDHTCIRSTSIILGFDIDVLTGILS